MLLLLVGCNGRPDTVDITFDAGVGRFEDGETVFVLSIPSGSLITEDDIPTPIRSGYDFRGWYTDKAGTEIFKEDSPITSDLTLYAKWSPYALDTSKSYTVKFDLNYPNDISGLTATSVKAQEVDEGGKATEPTTKPKLTYTSSEGNQFDFTFGGWYSDKGCTEPFVFDTTEINNDTTVYAKWTPFMAYDEDSLLEWKKALEVDPSTNCAIIADITLEKEWEPISNPEYGKSSFNGTLYGNNCTISNLTDTFITSNDGGKIENLNFDIYKTIDGEGGDTIFGVITRNFGQIINCKVSGEINVTDDALAVGGISAYNNKDIIACHSDVAITVGSTGDGGSVYIGGIAGENQQNGTINASYFTGSITGTGSGAYVGGIAATNDNTNMILACYSTGTLPTSGRFIGGIVASNKSSGSITSSYWVGDTVNGVGNDSDYSGTQKVTDGSWEAPMNVMNAALSDSGYEYVSGSSEDNVPLVIQPKATN